MDTSETYAMKLAAAILKGLRDQLQIDEAGDINEIAMGMMGHEKTTSSRWPPRRCIDEFTKAGTHGVQEEEEEEEEPDEEGRGTGEGEEYEWDTWDASSGAKLDATLVRKAKEEELRYTDSIPLYDVVPSSESFAKTGKAPVSTKWTVVNKGDEANPEVRARWVARDFKTSVSDDFFASTPPWELIIMIISLAASQGDPRWRRPDRKWKKVGLIDISRAYFHTQVEEDIYVELPPERKEEGKCGKLRRYLYGMRGAARAFQEHVARGMKRWGFKQTRGCSCLFSHIERDINVIIHGDDFIYLGDDDQLT